MCLLLGRTGGVNISANAAVLPLPSPACRTCPNASRLASPNYRIQLL